MNVQWAAIEKLVREGSSIEGLAIGHQQTFGAWPLYYVLLICVY